MSSILVLNDPYSTNRLLKKRYLKHARLISFFLISPRRIQTVNCKHKIEKVPVAVSLNEGIPEEKWEEYLAAEAEAARKLKQEEEVIEYIYI